MELRIMKKDYEARLSREYKFITKCIFEGLTIAQIAAKLNYSQSTVANRLNTLFKRHSAKTRIEFIMSVVGQIIDTYKTQIYLSDEKINKLQTDLFKTKKLLSSLINSLSNKTLCEKITLEVKEFLKN